MTRLTLAPQTAPGCLMRIRMEAEMTSSSRHLRLEIGSIGMHGSIQAASVTF
jgi:hypothetical protein